VTTILLTGGTGQVGTGILAANRDRFDIVAPGRAELDMANPASVAAFVAQRDWDAIINCAAYTAVDRAESEPALAAAINAEAPAVLAQAAARLGIPLLHVSTDYVFAGDKDGLYVEDDPVAPLGVYGSTKEAGEQAVRTAGGRHIILRTAWVVSPWGNNFIKTMLRLGREREELGIVQDQRGCPTSAADIAETLLHLTSRLLTDPQAPTGTYHFVNSGEASWFDLASRCFERSAEQGNTVPRLKPIATSDYPTPAKRPANSRLATDRIAKDHGVRPRLWTEAVDDILKNLL